uniref:Uncharacterized protein n=1 Tax=Arundo donax TaxID=35708 RepID=A0A0A8ZWH0_ARUDO
MAPLKLNFGNHHRELASALIIESLHYLKAI